MARTSDEIDAPDTVPEEASDEEPHVYAVERDVNGWRFSRRKFLAATGSAAAALVAGAAGCSGSEEVEEAAPPDTVPPGDTPVPTDTLIPTHASPPTDTAVPSDTPEPTDTLIPVDAPEAEDTPTPGETSTPTETATPQLPQAQFVADVTVPDGTAMTPGESFTKTWRVKNSGAIPWGEGTQLVFASGARMGAISPVAVGDLAPGAITEISVDMTAPEESGEQTGRWSLKSADGTAMLTLTVVIAVNPGEPGEVPPGETGINMTGPGGETRTMPCGSTIPPGWTCTCNCVTVPATCSCDGHCTCDRVCTCDGVCTCEGHGHYWYPN
jgi:hypothetical protein